MLFAERPKFFGCEVSPIICDNAVGYSEAIYDGLDELDSCSGSRTCDGYSLNPLGEFVPVLFSAVLLFQKS